MLFESSSVRIELDDQIATLWLDCADRSHNRLTLQTLDELTQALAAVERAPCVDLLIVRSAKSNGFSSGYELKEVERLHSLSERLAFAACGQQVMQKFASLKSDILTIAVVEGECRSGGLELALACDYRVAVSRPDTVFAFPDIAEGLIPCWGATYRLPRLIGIRRALDMLLQGAELSGQQAFSCGLVDLCCNERNARLEIQAFVERLQDSPRKGQMPRRLGARLRDGMALGRWRSFQQAAATIVDIADDRPAAQAVYNAVRSGYVSPGLALIAEREAFSLLADSETFQNAFERSRQTAAPARIYPEPINPIPALPERIGIVGGGEMGASLAVWFALHGRHVAIQELSEETLQLASDRLDAHFHEAVATGRISHAEAEQAKKNICRTTTWNGFDNASLAIEAVDEDLGIKRSVFHELEQRVRPRTILATTSSTVRVEAIQAEMQRPGRVVGIHLLEPMQSARLVELVRAPATDSSTLATLDSWMRLWGKTPILVNDRPGRLVSRVQLAYFSEAVVLVAEGLPPDAIDRGMRLFGMKYGPLEAIDAIGFDKLARLVESLQLARGDNFANNLLLERLRAFGWNGRDSGEGFYRYGRGNKKMNHLARMIAWREADEDVVSHYVFDPRQALDDGTERLVLRAINETAACLADEPDADPGLVDMAMALGMNWAPHLGGPLRHADKLGLLSVVERLNEFAERFGKRFEPCIELQRRAEAGESFYESMSSSETLAFPSLRRMAG